MNNCKKLPLSELMTQHTAVEKISDMKNERYITLSSNGNGAHERVIKDGKYPVPFSGYRVSEGQFIYSRIDARNGAYDIIPSELDGFVVSKDFPVFDVDTSKVLPRFLLRSVLSNGFIEQVKHSSFGATNRMRIKEDVFGSYLIRIPPLDIQNNIVECLDKAQSIIKYRRDEIIRLDELVKAQFVELFGDMSDPMCKWDKCKLVDVCSDPNDIKCGPFGTQLGKDEYTNSGVEVWEIPQINSEFRVMPTHFVSKEKAQDLEQYSIKSGDIAMSRKGNVGRCAVFPETFEEGIIHSDVLRIRVDNSRVAPVFMMRQLHYSGDVQHQIELVSSGAIMAGINVTKLKEILVYIPPKGLQDEFVSFVKQVDKSKVVIQKALDATQLLFSSLMQLYFG